MTAPREPLLPDLLVFDRLTVGPVNVEPRRLIMPYQLESDGEVHQTELIYRYEEDVFGSTPDVADRNLAGLIGAQVALNYGLFCREIVFRGSFDRNDIRFLKAMAENTAREIYVNKFLKPNPFLLGSAARQPIVKARSHLQAKLIFPDKLRTVADSSSWNSSPDQHAVLSSGGKESLLSFGILRELGHETHSLFVNESGRHWFTALNGYRYLHQEHPTTTGRVWTNADRLFNWMLRHIPFIRPDFADHRADDYPIRLWTVAVFLFGILPVIRKRTIGRIIIGDEFDTSRKANFKGISHYDGLFDQSVYFDHALSRFFLQKGWGINQFSMVRTLSEYMVQNILGSRYPQLLTHQVSCHAAHTAGERVKPCGRCEKCTRVMSMLLAGGLDPRNCGYTTEQIQAVLERLIRAELHQESSVSEHVLYRLVERGEISRSDLKGKKFRPHPEILSLRFDPQRSPLDGLPLNLRRPIYRIFLEHAPRAVKRNGRLWLEFDPMHEPSLTWPYSFEPSETDDLPEVSQDGPALWGEMTWPEAERQLTRVDIALLPVGAMEQHGPHLPLDTDAWDAERLCRDVSAACADPKPLVLPGIPYGVSYHHEDFAGTISISPDILSRIIYEIGMGVSRNGITKLIIVNGHGGNAPALQFAAQLINRDARIFTCVDTGETSDSDINRITETPNDVHAGEVETSTSMHLRPELVRIDKAVKYVPDFSVRYLNFSAEQGVEWYARTMKLSPSGVLGDPTCASREKGEIMWNLMIQHLVEFVENIKGLPLEDIYEKRY